MRPLEYYQPEICWLDNNGTQEQKIAEYLERVNRLSAEFKRDLLIEYGIQEHPKRDACYAIAYDLANGNGLETLQCYFEQIVELIQD